MSIWMLFVFGPEPKMKSKGLETAKPIRHKATHPKTRYSGHQSARPCRGQGWVPMGGGQEYYKKWWVHKEVTGECVGVLLTCAGTWGQARKEWETWGELGADLCLLGLNGRLWVLFWCAMGVTCVGIMRGPEWVTWRWYEGMGWDYWGYVGK